MRPVATGASSRQEVVQLAEGAEPLSSPTEAYFEVANRCNSKCATCPLTYSRHEVARQLSVDEFRGLLEQAPVDPAGDYMVFGDIAYPGWVAYIDGRPTEPVPADGRVQAVPVPPGAQSVDMRFESQTLRAGLAISAATLAALTALFMQPLRWRRAR